MDDLTPPSLGGCHGAELTERLGVWAKEIMRSAEALKDLGEHIAAGGNERLSEDLRLAATRLAEVEAERDGLRALLKRAATGEAHAVRNEMILKAIEEFNNKVEGMTRDEARAALGAKP